MDFAGRGNKHSFRKLRDRKVWSGNREKFSKNGMDDGYFEEGETMMEK